MLKITKRDKKTMFLRTELASGEIEGEKFEVAMNIDGKALIYTFPEAIYTVNLYDLTDEVLKFRKEELKKKENGTGVQ
jgi:hypothetical protein